MKTTIRRMLALFLGAAALGAAIPLYAAGESDSATADPEPAAASRFIDPEDGRLDIQRPRRSCVLCGVREPMAEAMTARRARDPKPSCGKPRQPLTILATCCGLVTKVLQPPFGPDVRAATNCARLRLSLLSGPWSLSRSVASF